MNLENIYIDNDREVYYMKIFNRNVRFLFFMLAMVGFNLSPFFSIQKVLMMTPFYIFGIASFYMEMEDYEKRNFENIKESFTIVFSHYIYPTLGVWMFIRLFSLDVSYDMLIHGIGIMVFGISAMLSLDLNIILINAHLSLLKGNHGYDMIDIWHSFLKDREKSCSKKYKISLSQKKDSIDEGFHIVYDSKDSKSILVTDIIGGILVLKDMTPEAKSLKDQYGTVSYSINFLDVNGKMDRNIVSDIFNNRVKDMVTIKLPSKVDYNKEANRKNKSISYDLSEIDDHEADENRKIL